MAAIVYQNAPLADSAERSLELLLAPNPDSESKTRARLSENDVRQISIGLRRMGKDSWAKTPRLYAVLRMVNQVQVIDSFLTQGISDIWFPFSHKTLPESLRSASARFDFLELQDLVLTKAFDLEREDGRHRHFSKPEDIPLQKLEELGKGGFGFVDRVLSTVTYKEYARKLIPRGKTFKKNIEVLRDFERELGNLKKLSHIHIVELVGSYTDPKFVGILMSPVADYNLKDFLGRESLSSGERSFLRTFFGCLASALCYLHEERIRHKDIKPQNVLVKGHQVFLTDFGISLDWSELGQSTTTGVTIKTPRYCAPEVADYLPRNSLSDMWSLGCVFLEIWTVLKGETTNAIFSYLEGQGTKSTCYYLNCNSALEWCNILEGKRSDLEENPPVSWVRGMLCLDQEQRWTAQTLVDRIQEANENPDLRYAFSGVCCISGDDTTDTDPPSKRSSMILEETGASSIGVYNPGSSTGELETQDLKTENLSTSLTVRPSKPLKNGKELSRSEQSLNEAIEASEATKSTPSEADIPIDDKLIRPERVVSLLPRSTSEDTTQSSVRRNPISRHISTDAAEGSTTTNQDVNDGMAGLLPPNAHELGESKIENEPKLLMSVSTEVSGHSTLPVESSQVYTTNTQEAREVSPLVTIDTTNISQRQPQSTKPSEPNLESDNEITIQQLPTPILGDQPTCSVCPTGFGAQDSYYEHGGKVYCHYHYSTQFAERCSGCRTAILKQFVEIFRNGQNQHWHPECYMIHKFWNVRLDPSSSALPRPDISLAVSNDQRELVRIEEKTIEEKVYRIWRTLSIFEESSASCISDMLLHVSNGGYTDGCIAARKLVWHIDILFGAIDSLAAFFVEHGLKELNYRREAKLLCRKVVAFFALLSKAKETGVRKLGVTQELLSLVTGLAHYLKLLIRIGLQGALKSEREKGTTEGLDAFLEEVDDLKTIKENEMKSIDFNESTARLANQGSDCCAYCGDPIEDECVMIYDKRWHVKPPHLNCNTCKRDLTHDVASAAYSERENKVYCTNHYFQAQEPVSGFVHVTKLQQYVFLLRVALARLQFALFSRTLSPTTERPNLTPDNNVEGHRLSLETKPPVSQPADRANATEGGPVLLRRFSWETENGGATTAVTFQPIQHGTQGNTPRPTQHTKNASQVSEMSPVPAPSAPDLQLATEAPQPHAGKRRFFDRLKAKVLDTSG